MRRTTLRGTDNFPIGIIGGTGGMGRWFADFFEKEGHPVLVSGGTGERARRKWPGPVPSSS